MTLSGPADASQFPADLDGVSDQAVRSLEVLARALHVKDARLEPALQAIVAAAVQTVSPAEDAGLILVLRGELVPQATTGAPPQLLDQLQRKLKDGPCISAAEEQTLIRIDDMGADSRWPDVAAAARGLGVHSMLCVPLWVHEQRLGALSLYAPRAGAFTGQDEPVTRLFATLAAIALAEAQRTDQLYSALDSRDVIGQAKGILMERHRITAEVAFQLLSRSSQQANLKLAAVARDLVDTGELPGTGLGRRIPG
jgi:GAF domain-containing protein